MLESTSVRVDVTKKMTDRGEPMTLAKHAQLKFSPGVMVVRRSATSVQIGTDPRTSLIVHNLDASEVRFLAYASDFRVWNSEFMPAGLDHVERQLRASGMLLDQHEWSRSTAIHSSNALVGVVGTGPLAEAVVDALHSCGIPTVTPDRYFGNDPVDQAEQLAQWTVVMLDRHVADPVRARTLMSSCTPHLSVVEREASVDIGPFVYPGHNACLQCADLHRADADDAWGLIAAQLLSDSAAVPELDQHIYLSAASVVASQIRMHVAGRKPPTAWHPKDLDGSSIIAVRAPAGLPALGHVPAHPDCGCLGLPEAELEHADGRTGYS